MCWTLRCRVHLTWNLWPDWCTASREMKKLLAVPAVALFALYAYAIVPDNLVSTGWAYVGKLGHLVSGSPVYDGTASAIGTRHVLTVRHGVLNGTSMDQGSRIL